MQKYKIKLILKHSQQAYPFIALNLECILFVQKLIKL